MTTELCPTFLMNGEDIVDVFYTPLKFVEGHWQSYGVTEFKPTGRVDRTVVETPVGCFEFRYQMRAGDTLVMSDRQSGGPGWTRCQRSTSQTADVLVEATL